MVMVLLGEGLIKQSAASDGCVGFGFGDATTS
jgi:hypothetical protein